MLSETHKSIVNSENYEKKVKDSIKHYWANQKTQPLNELLKKGLEDHGLPQSYIFKANYLPIQDSVRDLNGSAFPSTSFLIFRNNDIRSIYFSFGYELFINQHIIQLTTNIDLDNLKVRPMLHLPGKETKLQKINVLVNGYWGFADENTFGGICPYQPKLQDLDICPPFVQFYALRTDGKLGWTYFPVSPNHEDKISLRKIISEK